MSRLAKLPAELLLPIAALLTEDDLRRLSQACRKFRKTLLPSFLGQLWVTFSRSRSHATSLFLAAIGSNPDLLAMIRKVRVDCTAEFGGNNLDPVLRERLNSLPTTVHEANLRLHHQNEQSAPHWYPRAEVFTRLVESLAMNARLHSLHISIEASAFSKTVEVALNSLALALPSMRSLRRFSFGVAGSLQFPRPAPELEKRFGDAMMTHCETLEFLEWNAIVLFWLHSDSETTPFILDFLEKCGALRELRIGHAGMAPWFWLVVRALNANPRARLTALAAEGTFETLKDACEHGGGAGAFAYVNRLDLILCNFNSLEVLEEFGALRTLNLSFPGVFTSVDATLLGSVVGSLKCLETLFIGGLWKEQDEIIGMLCLLASSPTLQIIRMRGVSATRPLPVEKDGSVAGGHSLAQAFPMSKLQLLEWNGVTVRRSSFGSIEKILFPQFKAPPQRKASQIFFSMFNVFRRKNI